ncbi:MAG: VanW family protein [Clostridia bacterium]|nr:VanW family protein [Clostridia bacterium]
MSFDDINRNNNTEEKINNETMQGAIIPAAVNGYKKAPVRKKLTPVAASILIVCLLIIAALAGIYLYSFLQNEKYSEVIDKDTFYEGIYIDNINLTGLTKAEAITKVNSQLKADEGDIIVTVIWDENEKYTYTAEDVNVSYNTSEIIEEAYNLGRSGSDSERYNLVLSLAENNVHMNTTRTIDPSPIEDEVREIALSKSTMASEPAVAFHPDKNMPKEQWFSYDDPVPGIQTDDEALWQMTKDAFTEQTFGEIEVPKWEILPETNLDYREITQLIVSFKTVQARNSNREHNIALACSLINGSVVLPGEEFSMNNTTGQRTAAAGFKEANTIIDGNELVPDIAGGVCQVSGTLFNAALLSDLEITERFHHSFELGYLKRGRDATVNYGTADLKFVNTLDHPIYIAMYTDGLNVYAEIYGPPLENCDHISIWVKTINTIPVGDPVYVKDSTVPVGGEPVFIEGRQGITCEVYKIYNDKDGNQIGSEYLYTDVYKHFYPEIRVNPSDYEGYINPTPEPTDEPTPSPSTSSSATASPTASPSPTPDEGSAIG